MSVPDSHSTQPTGDQSPHSPSPGHPRKLVHRLKHHARRLPLLRDLPKEVAVLAAIAFCVALGFGIAAPAIPIFARSFGVSAFLAGAVVSVFAFVRLLSAAPAGSLVNKLGERKILSLGLAIVAISSAVAAFAPTFTALLIMRGVGGIGSSMFTVSAMALLLRTVSSDQRGRASGAFSAGFLFGGVAGPAVGGIVVGISIRAPFIVYAVTLAAATFVSWTMLRDPVQEPSPGPAPDTSHSSESTTDVDLEHPDGSETDRDTSSPEPTDKQTPLPLSVALRNRAYWAALATNLGNGFAIFGLRSALVPLFVVEGLRQGPSMAGYGFLIAAAIQAALLLPAGRMADERGRRPAMIIGSAASVAGMLLLALDAQVWLFLAAMAVLGVAGAFLSPAPAAVVGDVIGGRPGGKPIAVFQMVSDFGAIIGPLAAGLMLDVSGFSAAFGIGAVMMLLGFVAAVIMPETLRRRARSDL